MQIPINSGFIDDNDDSCVLCCVCGPLEESASTRPVTIALIILLYPQMYTMDICFISIRGGDREYYSFFMAVAELSRPINIILA